MDVQLPDGTVLALDDGATGADAAAAIGPGLARAARAGPRPIDSAPARSGEQALELIRHDAAHVLAAAMLELYPGVKISIGPPIENGFYYDFDFPEGVALSDADFPRIEEKMREHIKADERFVREDVPVAAARERFVEERQDYKVELIDDLIRDANPAHPLDTVSLYTNG